MVVPQSDNKFIEMHIVAICIECIFILEYVTCFDVWLDIGVSTELNKFYIIFIIWIIKTKIQLISLNIKIKTNKQHLELYWSIHSSNSPESNWRNCIWILNLYEVVHQMTSRFFRAAIRLKLLITRQGNASVSQY